MRTNERTHPGALKDEAEGDEHEGGEDGEDGVEVAAAQVLALRRLPAHHALVWEFS